MTLRFAGIVVAATGLAVLAVPLTGLWEPATDMSPGPARTALIAEGMVENVAFGIGIAVLCLGLPLFTNVIPDRRRAIVAWLATVWLLVLWMPHGNLHRYVGMDTVGLVPIE